MTRPEKQMTRKDFTPSLVGEVVKITWEDCLNIEEIEEKKLDKEPPIIFSTYGEVIRDTEKHLTVAGTTAIEKRDKLLREVVRIPRSLVRSIQYLETVDEIQIYASV